LSPRQRPFRHLLAVLSLLLAVPARAELVVVVSHRSSITSLTRDQVINIYMGRYRVLPDGGTAHPLDAAGDSPERSLFYRSLLGKSLDDVSAYWARLVFSGRTAPPREVPTRRALLEEIDDDATAIGYVARKELPRNLKVVFTLPE
jgi:hypothetical protein